MSFAFAMCKMLIPFKVVIVLCEENCIFTGTEDGSVERIFFRSVLNIEENLDMKWQNAKRISTIEVSDRLI